MRQHVDPAGNTLRYAFGNQPDAINAVHTPPGGNQMWDLSGLQADSSWEASSGTR